MTTDLGVLKTAEAEWHGSTFLDRRAARWPNSRAGWRDGEPVDWIDRYLQLDRQRQSCRSLLRRSKHTVCHTMH